MFLDALNKLSAAQAVTDTDAYSTNTIDLGNTTPKREIGAGEPLCLMICVDVAAAGSTDTTDIMVVHSDNANLSSHAVLAQRRIAKALLTAGSRHFIPIPPGSVTKRYLGARYELGSGDTITVTAYIVPQNMIDVLKDYADAITIS
jgi:hypothetical protein